MCILQRLSGRRSVAFVVGAAVESTAGMMDPDAG